MYITENIEKISDNFVCSSLKVVTPSHIRTPADYGVNISQYEPQFSAPRPANPPVHQDFLRQMV